MSFITFCIAVYNQTLPIFTCSGRDQHAYIRLHLPSTSDDVTLNILDTFQAAGMKSRHQLGDAHKLGVSLSLCSFLGLMV